MSHAPLPVLLLQILVVIAASRGLWLVLRPLGQPLVVAEIAAGIVLGPSLLGWLAPGVMDAVFPPASLPLLGTVSQLGLVLFMFLVGLELDPGHLRGRGRAAVLISHSSIAAPLALGAGLAVALHADLAPPGVPVSSFALFLGVAMSITAFPVLARILAERRLARSTLGALALTCAAVDDVTAWCLLAFVVSVVRADGLGAALATTGLAAVFVLVMLAVVRPALARAGAIVVRRGGLGAPAFAATMVALLASAWVTERAGLHALFGAFVLGVAVPRVGGLPEALAARLEDVTAALLLPLFFAVSGLRTEVGLLDAPSAWATCALVVAVACLGKFGGTWVAARWTGLGPREASALGVLMNTRGLMELVVLNIGLDLGVISPELFTMMVVMALVTTVVTSPILARLYPDGLDEAPVSPR